ncbi:hypothetical protein GCM10007881_55380 [Mesorhizobium huakuii]|uniref:hypothetical protein n=1 Tax=Mesorhizobium huakuii TaxID=28104 RepID=UPI00235D495B|nr:hypothetical protein [Mesorhizobium huakuii]GLQ82017.1 hypothetical protein GCM10007881_55380 [Mesorhizobium huakuii]
MDFLKYGSAGAVGFLIGLAAVVWIGGLSTGGIFLVIIFFVAVSIIVFALAKFLFKSGDKKPGND